MRKRDLSRVTKNHVIRLEEWVGEENKDFCPFTHNGIECEKDICYDVFPSLKGNICPCWKSTVHYVTEVARKIIKELS